MGIIGSSSKGLIGHDLRNQQANTPVLASTRIAGGRTTERKKRGWLPDLLVEGAPRLLSCQVAASRCALACHDEPVTIRHIPSVNVVGIQRSHDGLCVTRIPVRH